MQDQRQDTRVIKIILLGSNVVGKTSFMERWVNNEPLKDSYQASIGYDFLIKNNPDKNLKFECWDAPGQERFRSIIFPYLKRAHILVFMFDVTREDSLNELSGFISEAKKQLIDPARFVLIANKIDQTENRITSDPKALEFAHQQGIKNYVAVSVKTEEGMALFQEKMESLAFSLPIKPKPINAKTLSPDLCAEIETLEKLYTDNPRRGGRVAVQAIAKMLKESVAADDAQKYFDDHFSALKQHFNTLQLTWRSVVNTVLNVVLSALITLTVVGLPLLYCFNLWKPNKDSLQHSFRFMTFGDKQQAEKVCHAVMEEQDVKLIV